MWQGFEMGNPQLRGRHRLVHTVRAVFVQVRSLAFVLEKLLMYLNPGVSGSITYPAQKVHCCWSNLDSSGESCFLRGTRK